MTWRAISARSYSEAPNTGRWDTAAAAAASPANSPLRVPASPGSALRPPMAAAPAPSSAGRRASVRDGGVTGNGRRRSNGASMQHVESSLQREFEEVRMEYAGLLERASRGRVGDLGAGLEDIIGRLEAKSAQIAGFQYV